MMTRPHILHLVDDATPGGVMRVLDHIQTCPEMARSARHEIRVIHKAASLPQLRADMIVSHLAISWRSLPALIAFRARHAGTPLVHVEHSYTEAFTAQNVTVKMRFFTLLRSAYALFDKVVAVSSAQGAWLSRRTLVPQDALWVIPPVVDLDRFRALARRNAHGPETVIGAIGRLHRQKGFDVLIEAFRTLSAPNLSLHIFGSGPEEEALRGLAAGDARIRFFAHTAAPEQAMAQVDCVALPSRWEAFGLVALEARAANRPLLCADLDGLHDSAGPAARFVTGHAVGDWANALGALTNAPHALGQEGRAQGVEAEFACSWQTLIQDSLGTLSLAA